MEITLIILIGICTVGMFLASGKDDRTNLFLLFVVCWLFFFGVLIGVKINSKPNLTKTEQE